MADWQIGRLADCLSDAAEPDHQKKDRREGPINDCPLVPSFSDTVSQSRTRVELN